MWRQQKIKVFQKLFHWNFAAKIVKKEIEKTLQFSLYFQTFFSIWFFHAELFPHPFRVFLKFFIYNYERFEIKSKYRKKRQIFKKSPPFLFFFFSSLFPNKFHFSKHFLMWTKSEKNVNNFCWFFSLHLWIYLSMFLLSRFCTKNPEILPFQYFYIKCS